jgi:hypothetical protein
MISKTLNRPSSASRKSSSEKQFPGKLHDMMTFVEQVGLEHIVSWIHNGRGFMVHDPEKMVEILPLFFSQTQYRSFSRQANMWHFERVLDGNCKGAFVHPYFLRGQKLLCGKMSRHIKLPLSSYPMKSKQLGAHWHFADEIGASSVDYPSKAAISSPSYSSTFPAVISSFCDVADSDHIIQAKKRRVEREFIDGALTYFAGRQFFFLDIDDSPRKKKKTSTTKSGRATKNGLSSCLLRETFLAQQA